MFDVFIKQVLTCGVRDVVAMHGCVTRPRRALGFLARVGQPAARTVVLGQKKLEILVGCIDFDGDVVPFALPQVLLGHCEGGP